MMRRGRGLLCRSELLVSCRFASRWAVNADGLSFDVGVLGWGGSFSVGRLRLFGVIVVEMAPVERSLMDCLELGRGSSGCGLDCR